uniref:Glutamine and serine rich 1 n=2 Tax=Oryzias melastigma TaxID=30732 RepID=A0A3B3D2L8_ORYME
MMDRNYPSSSFSDALAAPPQTVASWAYERGSATIKPSYGATLLDGELLQQQSYASSHQLPSYNTLHVPAGAGEFCIPYSKRLFCFLKFLFFSFLKILGSLRSPYRFLLLSGTLESSSSSPVTSVMSFLTATESRSLQAGPASASLLPPFRPPSWPTGTNTSTTDLYLTSALPSTATFPSPAALSSYQHTGAYASRNYATNASLSLQDPAFSASNNGLFSHHDHLLHLKSSQTVLPTALAFNHLSASPLGSALPVQSSTYRSAQESAPHLLQPQFSLLPSALPSPQGAAQPYGATVFSSSIERALQRECSVIKHHQRPSSGHVPSEQLPSSEHSLQGYFGSSGDTDVSYQQDPPHHSPVSSSPSTTANSSQGASGSPQPKSDCVAQTYSSVSLLKPGDSSFKLAPSSERSKDIRSMSLKAGSPEHYSSPDDKQNSLIANQQAVQLSNLIADSLPQTYITALTQSQSSHSTADKLSSVYTTLSSLSSHSENMASVGPNLAYSSNLGQEVHYGTHVQTLCQDGSAGRYPTSHSQDASSFNFTSQEQSLASQSQSFSSGQSLNSSYPLTCGQSLPTSNSTMDFSGVQDSKAHSVLSQTQTQNVLSSPLPTYSSTQTLQNGISSSGQDIKPTHGKEKMEALPFQDMEALRQTSMVSNSLASHNIVYVVSKIDEQKPQSVIRSNSCDEHLMGLNQSNVAEAKDELMCSVSQNQIHLSSSNGHQAINTKPSTSIIVPSLLPLCPEQLKQPPPQLQPELHQQNQQTQSQNLAVHTQFITVPSNKVLLESSQMILVQQPLVHQTQNNSKLISLQGFQPAHSLGPVHVQYLHMDRDLLGHSISEPQGQQGTIVSEPSSECLSAKNHCSQAAHQQPADVKNHFALNSICFPESMLLTDDRSILSNVDDILAATVAACGVTPQDFKAATSAEADMTAMSSSVDSKRHLQTIDMRQMSAGFSSAQQAVMANTNSHTVSISLNGDQTTTDCQHQPVHSKSTAELEINGDGKSSERGYSSEDQVFDSVVDQNKAKENPNCAETENKFMLCPDGDDSTKKKARSKSQTKPGCPEDEGGLARPVKRSGQTKRQNSKGSDVSSPTGAQSMYEGCPQQERIRQKIREVEEKQPEVKSGFIGSFLDFIKSGPKQQYSQNPMRTVSRPRKPSTSSKPSTLTVLPCKVQSLPGPLLPQESPALSSQQKRLEDDLQKNLETLPSFSSDEEESTGRNQALRNSITSALSSLDEASDRKTRTDNQIHSLMMRQDHVPSVSHAVAHACLPQISSPAPVTTSVSGRTAFAAKDQHAVTPTGQLAMQLPAVAVEGLTDEELSDSGGEGMYRERDEFVVRNEDIETLKETMKAGSEPPAIWKVQKALLQKFVPELRDGKRVFSATNSYLGYFGDAKTMYHRVYVKFLDTVNKREYVRVCSRKPRCKPLSSLRGVQVKTLLGLTAPASSVIQSQKPRVKQIKPKAEPPPKKRRKWKEEFSQTASGSSAEDDESNSTLSSRFLKTRTMKETFRSFVELLISIALDEDVMTALERANDELLLPHMKRVDGLITDNRKRLLHKLHLGQVLKMALDSFPEISVVTELKKDGETPAFKVRLSGKAYNKKTMKPHKVPSKVPQEYTVDQQKTQWFSLYHSLQHYKYHTYLMCKDEIASLRVQTGDLGQEETVKKCLENGAWVEGLFDRFGELINQVQQVCR